MASPAVVVTEFEEDTTAPQEAIEEQEENDEVRALKYKEHPRYPGNKHIISSFPSICCLLSLIRTYVLENKGGSALPFIYVTEYKGLANPRLMKIKALTQLPYNP